MLKLPGAGIASTRAGGTINLVDVLDEACQRARAIIDEKDAERVAQGAEPMPDDVKAAAIG